MNLLKLSVFFRSLLLILITSNFVNCVAQVHKLKVVEVQNASRIEVSSIYEYSEESMIKYDQQSYSLRYRAVYDDNGVLNKLVIYKPEGHVEYRKSDLFADTNLTKMLSLPMKHNWKINVLSLEKDNGEIVQLSKVDDLIMKSEKDDKVIFYKLKDVN